MKKFLYTVLVISSMLFLLVSCASKGEVPMNTPSIEVSVSDTPSIEADTTNSPDATPTVSNPEEAATETIMDSDTVDSNSADDPITTIRYVGNSCFYIVFSDGTRLVTDPYGSRYSTAFSPFPSLDADIITLSHRHDDHMGIYDVKGDPEIIYPDRLNETIKVGSVEITGYPSKHVADMGNNTIFVFKINDLTIVHMGEADLIEDEEAIKAIQSADVLLVYAGEYGAVKNETTFQFAFDKDIKVLIPQHFSMDPDNLWYGQPSIDSVLEELPEEIFVAHLDELIVNKGMEKQFVVLKPMGMPDSGK